MAEQQQPDNALAAVAAMLNQRRSKNEAAYYKDQQTQLGASKAQFGESQSAYQRSVDLAEAAQAQYDTDRNAALSSYNGELTNFNNATGQRAEWEAGPGQYKTLVDQREYDRLHQYFNVQNLLPSIQTYINNRYNSEIAPAWAANPGQWPYIPPAVTASQGGTWATNQYAVPTAPTLSLPAVPNVSVGEAPSFSFVPSEGIYGKAAARTNQLAKFYQTAKK